MSTVVVAAEFTAGVAVGAISVTIARGSIFAGFREWLGRWTWVQKLFSCAYCLSHWVAATVVLMTGLRPVTVVGHPVWSWSLSTMFYVAVAMPVTAITIALMSRIGVVDNEERKRLRSLLKEAAARIRELEQEKQYG